MMATQSTDRDILPRMLSGAPQLYRPSSSGRLQMIRDHFAPSTPYHGPPGHAIPLPPCSHLEQLADRGIDNSASVLDSGWLQNSGDNITQFSDQIHLPGTRFLTMEEIQDLTRQNERSRCSSLAPSLTSVSSSKSMAKRAAGVSKSVPKRSRGNTKASEALKAHKAPKAPNRSTNLDKFDPLDFSRTHLDQQERHITDMLGKLKLADPTSDLNEHEFSTESESPQTVHNVSQSKLRKSQAQYHVGTQRILTGTLGWVSDKLQSSGNAKSSGLLYQTKHLMEASNDLGGFILILLKYFVKPEDFVLIGPRLHLFRLRPTNIATETDRMQAIVDASKPAELQNARSIAEEAYLIQQVILPLAREEVKGDLAQYCSEILKGNGRTPLTPPSTPLAHISLAL